MRVEDFVRIRRELRNISDIERLSRNPGVSRGTLFSILVQKKVSFVRRNYRRFESRVQEIAEFWEKNKRFPRWLKLPKTMKLRLLFKGLGFTKREISKALKHPDSLEEFSDLIYDAILTDFVYSPIASENLRTRGTIGEKITEAYLQSLDVEYLTERELRGGKTPDFLVPNGIELGGAKVYWIDSKAMFGDIFAHEEGYRKQFRSYVEEFGRGAVIYWLGFLDAIKEKDIVLLSDVEVEHPGKRLLRDMTVRMGEDGDFTWNGGSYVKSEKFVFELIRLFRKLSDDPVVSVGEESGALKRVLRNFGYRTVNVDSAKK